MEERSIPDKFRSSYPQMFFKIAVLKNFANFTGKHLSWSLFLIKRDSNTGVFLWNLGNEEHRFLQNTSSGCFRKLKYRKKSTTLNSEGLKRGAKRLKSDSHLPKKKKLHYLLHWKPFKNDEKCFLFYLKSSFRSQDILVFVMAFWSCRKNSLIRKIRFISKFMTSQPG